MKKKVIVTALIMGTIGFGLTQTKIQKYFRENKPAEYVWCMGFAHDCDVTFSGKNKRLHSYLHPEKIRPNDTVWVESRSLPIFVKHYLPKIEHPIVLVLTHGDESFPSSFTEEIDIEVLINNPNILHVFAQNCDYTGPSHKVSHLPIGLDFHTMANKEKGAFGHPQTSVKQQEKELSSLLSTLQPTTERKKKALVDFQLHDTMQGVNAMNKVFKEDRTEIFQKIANSGVIDVVESPIPRLDLWKKKGEYAFSICPPGNGYDTHRVWEDLLLGCIAIVKSSPLNPLYEGLPVVIVEDWTEVNEENFSKWLSQYGDVFHNPSYREKFTHVYWMNQIDSCEASPRVKI